ncbi:MAG: GGDEF domain-containing protein [Treponema sp.]|nr:GGDEF domain-containing protein [Treponema sp.]
MQEIKTKSIAVLTGQCSINEENDAVRGICSAAKKVGWNVFIFNALKTSLQNDLPVLETSIFSLLNFDSISGVIITQNIMNDKELGERLVHECKAHKIPVFSLGYKSPLCHSYFYESNDYLEHIVDHVIEKHGCKTLNLVAGIENNVFSENRIKAFKNSLKKHNLSFDKRRLFYGQFWEGPTSAGMKEFFNSGLPLPDAFICCNDLMAMTVCSELYEHGYSVPKDVIVTGYDGIEFEHYSTPRLTTAKCNYETLGSLCFENLVKIITGKKVPKHQTISPELIFSESCGCQNGFKSNHNNLAMKAMKNIGGLRYIGTLTHMLATAASYANSIEDLRRVLPSQSYYNPNCWVLLNHDYDSPQSPNPYSIKNPFSEKVDCFLIPKKYDQDNKNLPISHKEYIPHLKEVIESGITNIVFMNLTFGDESIGYMAVPYDHLGLSLDSMEVFAQGLSQGLSSIKYRTQLEYMTVRDMLTGIYNRRGFFSEMDRKFEEAKEKNLKKHHFIVFSIDMDELKYINDTYGHREGDFAITKMAEMITKAGGPNATTARFGGDEFVIAIFTNENVDEMISKFKENLNDIMIETNKAIKKPYKIKASLGAESSTINTKTKLEKLIAKADELMYTEKASKKQNNQR